MAILSDKEFFDFDGVSAKVVNLTSLFEGLGQSIASWAGNLKAVEQATLKDLSSLKVGINGISVTADNADRKIAEFISRIGQSGQVAEVARKSQASLTEAQRLNAQAVESLTARYATLVQRYNSLDENAKDFQKQQKAIATEMKTVTRAIDAQSKSLQVGKSAIDAAEGSLAHLKKQTAELKKTLDNLPGAYDLSTKKINEQNKAAVALNEQYQKNIDILNKVEQGQKVFGRNVGNYGSAFTNLSAGLSSVASQVIGISSAFEALKATIEVVADFERLDAGLRAVSRDTDDFKRSQQFLIDTSSELGLKYESLVKSYKLLKAATKDTSLEGETTNRIFHAVAEAGARLQLTTEETEGALNALQQMISKGNIQAEELRGQLGDRLPGALKIMAAATGVSTSELDKMMEKGQLLAVDVLPKFAKELDKIYGGDAQGEIDNMTAGWNRMTNEAKLFIAAFNDNKGVSSFFGAIENGIASVFSDLRMLVTSNEWGLFFQYLGGNVAAGQANAAFRRASDAIRAKADAEFKAKPLSERQKETDAAIAKQEAIKNQLDAVVAQPYSEANTKREIELQEQYNKAKARTNYLIKLSIEATKEQERVEAAAAKEKADADKQRKEKEEKERTAAERKAEAARNKARSEALSKSKSTSDDKLADLNNDKQNGLISEQTFIEERLKITLNGLKEREAILKKYGKQETDDYINIQKEKKKADTEYKSSQLNLDIKNNKNNTDKAVSALDIKHSEGGLSDLDYEEQRHKVLQAGIKQEMSIIKEAGLQESELYKDAYQRLLDEQADYQKRKLKAEEKEWKDTLIQAKDALKQVNDTVGAELENRLQELEKYYTQKEALIKLDVAKGNITPTEGDAKVYALQMAHLKDQATAYEESYMKDRALSKAAIDDKIEDLKNLRDYGMMTPAEIEAANEAIRKLQKARDEDAAKDKMDLDKKVADNGIAQSIRKSTEEIRNEEKAKKKRDALIQLGADFATTIGDTAFSVMSSNTERESQALEKQHDNELKLAGDNADAKARIDDQYNKRKAEIARKQAIAEREQALFSIAIRTAMGVASVLSTGGGTYYADLGISAGLLTAFVIATGALEAAAVLARPIPAFFKGTSYAPEGLALVGDRGPELRQKTDGSYKYYDRPTIDYLNEGDTIYTASETSAILADMRRSEALGQIGYDLGARSQATVRLRQGRVNEQAMIYQIAMQGAPQMTKRDHYEVLAKALDERPVKETNIDANGLKEGLRRANEYREYMEKRTAW